MSQPRIVWQRFPFQREHATVLSFGGGVQTTALAILAAQGKVDPAPDFAIFGDTGGERPETYAHIWRFGRWMTEHGLPFYIVRHADMPLEDWVLTRSTPIPVFLLPSGIGRRQCTNKWKIWPIYRYIRYELAIRTFTMQIGISEDEAHRMKPPRPKYATNTWPLVDMGLTRQDCLDIIRSEGIEGVGKSACYFCPYQGTARWLDTYQRHPDLWERALHIERTLDGRACLCQLRIPLEELAAHPPAQALDGEECEGYCFV